jgi:two-component sensor histidine kinase
MDPDLQERAPPAPSFGPRRVGRPHGRWPPPAIADRRAVAFGAHLRALCAGVAASHGPSRGIALTCFADDEPLPARVAVRLGRVAAELVRDAFAHAFPGGRGGRIAVAFTAEPAAWRLAVEDSGVGRRPADAGRDGAPGLAIARALVAELGGRLGFTGVVGGTRCVAVVLRPRGRA